MSEGSRSPLDDHLQSVPREVAPERDLWMRIDREIRPAARPDLRPARPSTLPSRRSLSRTVLSVSVSAAAMAVVCVAGAVTWAIVHSRPGDSVAARATAETAQFGDLTNPRYVAARDALEHEFRDRLQRLDAPTRAKIETSLAVIRKAHDEIGTALAADPTSAVLEQLWQSTWHQELDLYDRVVQGTEPTFARI